MRAMLKKLYTQGKDQAISDILSLYDQEQSVTVNFVYFANIVAHDLFEDRDKTEKEREYKKILLKSDFLLPDGVGLQIFYAVAKLFGKVESKVTWLQNLNGTDFVPYFLEDLKKKYGSQKICILLYGTKAEYLTTVVEKLRFQGYNVIYSQDGYSDFDRDRAESAIEEYQDTINILLQARSTTKTPLQELWTSRNYQRIQQNKLLVFNTGGLFDFIAGVQKRAPKIVRIVKLEWLYRFILDPKRNMQKVLNSLQIFTYLRKYVILGKGEK